MYRPVATVEVRIWGQRVGAVARDAEATDGAKATNIKATSVVNLMCQRTLLIFAGSVMLLQLANAAMLPLMAGIVTWFPL